jgi:uncharacterized protein YhhL (DUF1145 family)
VLLLLYTLKNIQYMLNLGNKRWKFVLFMLCKGHCYSNISGLCVASVVLMHGIDILIVNFACSTYGGRERCVQGFGGET